MFQEEKPSSWFENTPNFLQRAHRIGNRAERPGADYKIEMSIGMGQRLRSLSLEVDGEGCLGAAHGDEFWKQLNRVDGMQFCDGIGVVWKIESGSNPELQDLTMNRSEQLSSQAMKFLSCHHPFHEAGEDMFTVKSHRAGTIAKVASLWAPELVTPGGLC